MEASENSGILEDITRIEEEISSLEKDISTKQEELDSLLREKENCSMKPTLNDIIQERSVLTKRIRDSSKLTNIEFSEIRMKPGTCTDKDVMKQFFIQGNCVDVPFVIEFDTHEMVIENVSEIQISNFVVQVSEQMVSELSEALQNVVESQSIQGFFRLLISYCKGQQHRTNLYDHFSQKYPDFVTIEEAKKSDTLVICHPQLKQGPVLTVSWEMVVESLCKTKPSIRLGVETHKQLVELDHQKTLEEAPKQFEDMVAEFGVEYAVDMLINLIKE